MNAPPAWTIDFANPPGAPGFMGPGSVHWRVFKNPVALAIGGVAAVLMEFADARIRTGVWAHSTFRTDPVGRSRRTGLAAMAGVYAPQAAARRLIAEVNRRHARVTGATPGGEAYAARNPDLLDWVSATASYGFLTAYDRFVAPLPADDRRRYYIEGAPVARLWGVQTMVQTDAGFLAMMEARAHRFEAHPIVDDFLAIVARGKSAAIVPGSLRRAVARASVSLLPAVVREKLGLGRAWDLGRAERRLLRTMGALADRACIPGAPPAQACARLGLPGDFLYRSADAQARLLARK